MGMDTCWWRAALGATGFDHKALCIDGDHCRCAHGLVCSDTGASGECTAGSGGSVECVDIEPPTAAPATSPPATSSGTPTYSGCVDADGVDRCLSGNRAYAPADPERAHCAFGDHCRCRHGLVCADTLIAGECAQGTGHSVHCVKGDTPITAVTT
eukprot:gene23116-14145_t